MIWDRILDAFRKAQPNEISSPPTLSRSEALARMLALVGRQDMAYQLGTGDRDWTPEMDCFGAAVCYAYGITRHRPGFNRGPWATVSDDLNCNSAIEDAEHKQELFVIVDESDVQPGDLIAYPTIRLRRIHAVKPFIGHIQMVTKVPAGWTRRDGFAALEVAHCHGPNGRRPAVTLGTGEACDRHDAQWAKPEHQTRILRVR